MEHRLYDCGMVKELWGKLKYFINKLFNISLTMNPTLCMLGVMLVLLTDDVNSMLNYCETMEICPTLII